MTLLQITDLTITSPIGSKLVAGLTLSLNKGERIGLIGESGSGKSLTALAILGLLPTDLLASGSILLSGAGLQPVDVITASENILTSIRGSSASIVFQEPLTALDPLMRIGRQLRAPIARHQGLAGKELDNAVLNALAEVRISDPIRILRAYPHEISGGERQRVAIAMALACKPQLLIADEPTTALDVSIQAEVLALIDEIAEKRGMAMLFISHDLAVVAQVVKQVMVMKNGETVEVGNIHDLLRNPTHPYTEALVKSAQILDSALSKIDFRGEQ